MALGFVLVLVVVLEGLEGVFRSGEHASRPTQTVPL